MKVHKTIMLVDDDRTSNFLNKKILNNLYSDIHIKDFLNSQEALDFLLESKMEPDLILLDINMPEIDGWEFIEELRKSNFHFNFPVIMLSSSIDEGDMDRAKSFKEIKGFITKPLRVDMFDKYLR